MSTPRTARSGVVLAYIVATVLAQAGHLHGHEAPSGTHCQTACGDARPHLSGHASVDLGRAAIDCPACQLRSVPLIVAEPAARPIEPRPVGVLAIDSVTSEGRPTARPSCRAPPLP